MLTVAFIMHEYLHKYFENIKKLDFFSIRNMRPLSNVAPPPRPGVRGFFLRLCLKVHGVSSRGPRRDDRTSSCSLHAGINKICIVVMATDRCVVVANCLETVDAIRTAVFLR